MESGGEREKQAPLGVLILGRKRPGFDQQWNREICEKALGALAELGFQTVGAETPVIDDASTVRALEQIEQAKCGALLLLQPSLAHGQLSVTILDRWAEPVVLWATPERPADGDVSSCSLVGQHLWASIFRQANHPFEFVYGAPEDSSTRDDLVRALSVAAVSSSVHGAKVGVVGTYVPGFVDLASEPFLLNSKLEIQLHALSLPQFLERVEAVPEPAVDEDVHRVRDLELPMNQVTADDLPVNSRCYLAMRGLMEEESLSALALQCWPEIPNMLGQWPYLAVSRLSTEGRAVAVEGDVDGAISMLINCALGEGPGFLTDWLEHDNEKILFWHPGMAPMNMCEPRGHEGAPEIGRHFNIVKPCVVNGRLRANEPVTVMRLWRCDNQYHLAAFEGWSRTPQRKLTGNTVLVEASGGDVRSRFDRLVHAGMPHHVLVVFGHHAEAFRRLARALGLTWWG